MKKTLRLIKEKQEVKSEKGSKYYTHYFLDTGLVKVQIKPAFNDKFNFKLLNQIINNQEEDE